MDTTRQTLTVTVGRATVEVAVEITPHTARIRVDRDVRDAAGGVVCEWADELVEASACDPARWVSCGFDGAFDSSEHGRDASAASREAYAQARARWPEFRLRFDAAEEARDEEIRRVEADALAKRDAARFAEECEREAALRVPA